MAKSAIGAGRKAGFYNYITQFVNFTEKDTPRVLKNYTNDLTEFINSCNFENKDNVKIALQSYLENYEDEFSKEKDYCKVRGEDNHFRYLPLKNVIIRVEESDTIYEVILRILAAKVSKVNFTISINQNTQVSKFLEDSPILFGKSDNIIKQNNDDFSKVIHKYKRVIYSNIDNVPQEVFLSAIKTSTFIIRQKPLMEGRLELLNYFEEQSISHSYHRYGNIGARGL